ncbi:MobA/MobL family protein [Acinetobacter bohemicus]|uniref:MobA/MobL family protein n=1 Tax=Acinetobacter sp. S4397-1 TaxID=2972915 RepID=UPI00209BA101|nr:MobA/MobL family protein [Acinetobacter sp. S4397-1]MCO8046333.1 MobA/MobL family protein [Acinetobacter sp. S4397-1]
MFYCNLEHTSKKAVKTRSGKVKNAATAKNRFHYITRTSHFKNYKESASEQIEFVRSGNMPNFAEGKPAEFWGAADIYERSNGRTCSSLVVALPKELNQAQRIELAEAFIAEFADRYRYPFTCAIHNHVGSLGGQEQPHLHFMYSERHVDGIDRTAEQFFKRYNPKDPQKGGAQKLTADVLGMGKAQLQLYRQKTEELINDSLMRYAPTKMVEIKGIQVEVPSLVSCLSNKEYNKKHGTQLKDVPVMNKAVRFAREKEPELVAERERMTAEINRLRAENHYELYRSFYEAELKNRQEIEELSTQAETPRTRQHWYAQEKLLFLQQKMLQALLQDRQMTEPFKVIQHDLQAYIDLLNIESFDRLEKFEYLTDLGQQLKNSVIQIASIEEELAFMQRQVIERVPLQMREKAVTPDKIRNHDQDNDFSPGF